MLNFYRKMQYTKSVNTIACVTDLVIIKYSGNNTTEIKRIFFTYSDLLPSALVVELELIHVYRTVGIPTYDTLYMILHVSTSYGRCTYRTIHIHQFQLNNESGW